MEDVFGKLLQHLSDQGLNSSQAEQLSALAMVPVANSTRLAPPFLLFNRLKCTLAPFAFEIPSSFITHFKVWWSMRLQQRCRSRCADR